jgi:hypothetical protein
MRLLDRAPVWLSVFSVPVSLWNPRDGSTAVGLAAGQGGPVCMHQSRSLGAVPGPRYVTTTLS